MPNLPDMVALVGCKGTPNRSTNLHSQKWTHVLRKNRNNKDLSEEELLMIFNQNAKRAETPKVTPRMFHSRSFFPNLNSQTHKKVVKNVPQVNKKFSIKKTFHVDHISIKNLKLQISKNDAILKKDLASVNSQIKSFKQTLTRSTETVLAQKALHAKLTMFLVHCLPSYWNQQWLRDSDLISPSSLLHIPRESSKYHPSSIMESLQQTVGDLKLKTCLISDDLHNWESNMHPLSKIQTYLPDDNNDDVEYYSTNDEFLQDTLDDTWQPMPYHSKPVSNKHKC
jgi:hypothetical protein